MTNNYKPQNSLEFLVIDSSLGKFFENPEQTKSSSSADKVHLLSNPPWKSSGSPEQDEEPVVDQTTERQKNYQFSPISRRLNSRMQLEAGIQSQRNEESPRTSPMFKRTRRGNKKRRSGCSPTFNYEQNNSNASTEMPGSPDQEEKNKESVLIPGYLNLQDTENAGKSAGSGDDLEKQENVSIVITNSNYITTDVPATSQNRLVINLTTIVDPEIHPDDPETPLADCNEHLFVPQFTDDSLPPPPSPLTLRRFLGLEDNLELEVGLSEEDLVKSRTLSRRYSSSSDSSTSTLI